MTKPLEGIELVRAVIELVRSKGFSAVFGAPKIPGNIEPIPVAPEVLERVRLDGDRPLTPCMREWLAFDGSLFGWIDRAGSALGERLSALATERFGDMAAMFETFERRLPRLCYALPFGDPESVHVVYPSAPDATGELPVLSLESENQQVLVTYPGIDAFLGAHAGLLEKDWRKRMQNRFIEHKRQALGGKQALEFGDDGDEADEPPAEAGLPPGIQKVDAKTYMMTGEGPVPDGFRVVREGQNPFTKQLVRFLAKG